VFTAIVPATMVAYIPWLILGATRETFDLSGWHVLGLVPLAAELAIGVACFAGFVVEGRGTPAPYDPPRRLVTGALYDRIRNPMYAGGTLILVGESIVFGSAALFMWTIAAWVIWHLFVVLYEEPGLRARFDGAYETYVRRVPRWIPRW
jgi:protein-S-isoprenylcysteine O-methyltransferase Ste14